MSLTYLEHAARAFEAPPPPRWAAPADLAADLDPKFRRTGAINLINDEIVETLNTVDGRLIVSMPPQEGKSTLTTKWPPPRGVDVAFVVDLAACAAVPLVARVRVRLDGHGVTS